MNLLITGVWTDAKNYIDELRSYGHEVVFMQWEKDELPCEYSWVEGVICVGLFRHHDIQKFTALKYIQLVSAGYDHIPMDYIKEHNIELHNAKGVYCKPMAECAIGGVLQLYKQSRFFYENQKAHKWEKHRALMELTDKNVLIVGCGDTGTECARLFKAFGCVVLGVNRTQKRDENFHKIFPMECLDELIPEADVIVLTIALTDETRHLMNAERLNKLKSTAILVNIARGPIVDTEALIEALPNIGGAVLDVFEEEPLREDSRLWEMENVIITPHNTYVSDNCDNRLKELILENIRNVN